MGTRSGDLDPGVLIYLMREKQFDMEKLEDLIDHRSGLLGVSGVSFDLRRLHEAASGNADARLAIEMFCYAVRKAIAAMIAALGGVDRIVFTGGIGENDARIRAAICDGLAWAGVSTDHVAVLPSREAEQIARHTWALTPAIQHRMD
jgi:acetate kinase